MKITSGSSAPKPTPAAGATGSSRTDGSSRQSAVQGSGTTATSGSTATDPATRLSQLEAQFAQADFNAAKVNEISSAIAAGRYQVNTSAVADKLLSSTGELAGRSGANS